MKEIILNEENEITQAILLENGKVIEQYNNAKDEGAVEGNIYCGIIENVLDGMQAAFVNIGEDKNAFIHIKDIIPKVSNETGNKEEDLSKYKIKDYIKQGNVELVQVKKDEENQKGARVSKQISLTGRLSVLMINANFVTVSQKISDAKEKDRLKLIATETLKKYPNEKYGIIIRTAAQGKQEEVQKDIEDLIELWHNILNEYKKIEKNKEPKLIYRNYNSITKFLTGVLENDISEITVNTEELYELIQTYLAEFKKKISTKIIKDSDEINKYNWKEQVKKAYQRKIWLKCGGFITIDKTEALTAIDVNSGKFIGRKTATKDETIFHVNKEATVEIARQLRLRNTSGIIVIDYIDMQLDEERNEILELLSRELKKDRSKTQVIGFTKLDLLEMTRKKI